LEDKLFDTTKEIIGIINSSNFKGSFRSTIGSRTAVEVLTTSLDRLHEWRENITSIPNVTIWKLCQNEPDCEIKRCTIQLKNIAVNASALSHPFCLSGADIIVLDYIIKGKLISKLEENETVSLKFSKKLESVTTKQVNCLHLQGVQWNNKGMQVGRIGGNIECLTNHLSSFTMVVLDAEVYGDNKLNL
ncbi:Hypothetical predicted protein, partial [Paramuricea clavata]